MFNWFKKTKEVVAGPDFKKGIPAKCFNGIYSRRDTSVDEFLDVVLKNSYLLDADDYYAYYRMPDQQILQMWTANDCAYINKGSIVKYVDSHSYYSTVKDLWDDIRVAEIHVARVYNDVSNGDIKTISRKYFKEYKRHGHVVRVVYEGCISPIFLKYGKRITEEDYKKELAVFLLKEA